MKKLLFSLMGLTFCGFMAQAQLTGSVTGTVVDAAQQPVAGAAVFFYGSSASWSGDVEHYTNYVYTDANGNYNAYYWGVSAGDSAVFGVVDCQGELTVASAAAGGNVSNHTIQYITCTPGACEALVRADSFSNFYVFEAVSLRDSAAIGLQDDVIHQWTIHDTVKNRARHFSPNHDTLMILKNSVPADFTFCYQRTAACSAQCDTIGTIVPITPPAPFCDAHFYVDSVNSINFQGQVVLWENSSVDTGSITDYHWDFGDGNTASSQYPTHTYSDTGIYAVCLTITAVNGGDTCLSTYCDSIGFDSNGNLVYKSTQQGFTINVMDPATVGQKEKELQSHFSLFPNPSTDGTTLNWSESVRVQKIDVMSINGQVVQSIVPRDSKVRFDALHSGAYMLRVQSDQGVTTMKMLVH